MSVRSMCSAAARTARLIAGGIRSFDARQWLVAAAWTVSCVAAAAALAWDGTDPAVVLVPAAYVAAVFGGAAVPAAAVAFLAGGAVGTLVAFWRGPGMSRLSAAVCALVPVLAGTCLVALGVSGAASGSPRGPVDLDTYLTGCLQGTAYDRDALRQVVFAPGTVTVVPEHGPELRFTRTDPHRPTPGRAETPRTGIVPADRETRRILDSVGCP